MQARIKVKTVEDAASPSSKSASTKPKKTNKTLSESHGEDQKEPSRSHPLSKEADPQKDSMTSNRPSKSAAIGSKGGGGGKEGKKATVGGAVGGHSESTRAEKDAKLHVAVLEAEHDSALEKHKMKLAEHEKWKVAKEAELEKKITTFVSSLWDAELKSIDKNVHVQVSEKNMEYM